MEITRTQVGLTVLFVSTAALLIFSTMGVLNPEIARGTSGDFGLSPTLIATLCLSALGFLGTLAGLIILATRARDFGRSHLWAVLGSILLFVLGVGVPIAGSLGGSFARTGDMDAYRSALTLQMVGSVLATLSPVAATWFLFKPSLRPLPGVIGVLRAIMAVFYVAAVQAHTTLASQTIQDQTFYMPQYDVPLRSGPVFNWQVANWAGAVLLTAQFALLLFATKETMVEVPDEAPTSSAEASAA